MIESKNQDKGINGYFNSQFRQQYKMYQDVYKSQDYIKIKSIRYTAI